MINECIYKLDLIWLLTMCWTGSCRWRSSWYPYTNVRLQINIINSYVTIHREALNSFEKYLKEYSWNTSTQKKIQSIWLHAWRLHCRRRIAISILQTSDIDKQLKIVLTVYVEAWVIAINWSLSDSKSNNWKLWQQSQAIEAWVTVTSNEDWVTITGDRYKHFKFESEAKEIAEGGSH